MKNRFHALGVACAMLLLPIFAHGNTIISTINGLYGVNSYDTLELEISNTTSYAFTNVTLRLTGYQGENNGVSQSRSLPDIGPGGYNYFWSEPTTTGNLFSYDYDDTGGNSQAGNPLCVQGNSYCAYTGNFYVTFTATWDGQAIYSQFSPDPTLPGAGNAAGMFVGWEGLNPQGLAETIYDDHSTGGPQGVLANIYAGTPPTVGNTPEPSSLLLISTGAMSALGLARRRMRR